MLDLLDLSIGKGKREPTADEKLAALSRDTRRRKKILQDAWAESQRIDTVKHAKIHGLVGYEMLRRKDEQKRDVEDWFRTLDVTRDGSVDARELIEPMAILGVARDRASVERLANAINEKDADGEPGLNMDEFREFAIANGLRPAELRKTAAKGSSDLLAVETQISVARRRQMLDALMTESTSPEKRKQLDQLRVIENCAEWAACVDPPAPKGWGLCGLDARPGATGIGGLGARWARVREARCDWSTYVASDTWAAERRRLAAAVDQRRRTSQDREHVHAVTGRVAVEQQDAMLRALDRPVAPVRATRAVTPSAPPLLPAAAVARVASDAPVMAPARVPSVTPMHRRVTRHLWPSAPPLPEAEVIATRAIPGVVVQAEPVWPEAPTELPTAYGEEGYSAQWTEA